MRKISCILFLTRYLCLLPTMNAATYDVGADDKEIRIGTTTPLTGPLQTIGTTFMKVSTAYIDKINKEGGINGRNIILIIKDDGFDPSKAMDLIQELIEKDRVLFIYATVATAPSLAAKAYLNPRKIPHLLLRAGADAFYDPVKAPYSISILPKYSLEGKLMAKYLLEHKPDAKIGILYYNSDFGKGYYNAFKDGLGSKAASMIVKALPLNPTDASGRFQIQTLKNSGANTFLMVVNGKLAVPTIEQAYDSGWKPFMLIPYPVFIKDEILEAAGHDEAPQPRALWK